MLESFTVVLMLSIKLEQAWKDNLAWSYLVDEENLKFGRQNSCLVKSKIEMQKKVCEGSYDTFKSIRLITRQSHYVHAAASMRAPRLTYGLDS